MVEVVVFDLGGTLYLSEKGVAEGNRARFDRMKGMGFEISWDKYQKLTERTAEIFDEKYAGSVKRFEDGRFSDILFDLWGKEVSWETKVELDRIFREEWLKNQELRNSARDVLQFCKDKGMKMGVITNGDGEMTSRIERDEIDHFFDVVVCSTDVGAEKSDLDPFQVFLDSVDVAPEQCLMVGNRMDEDIQAKKVGMKTVLLEDDAFERRPVNVKPDYRIGELKELKDIIKEVC